MSKENSKARCGASGGAGEVMILIDCTSEIKQALAARDKEWVAGIKEMFDNPEWEPDYHCGCGAYFERQWQKLQKSMGISQ